MIVPMSRRQPGRRRSRVLRPLVHALAFLLPPLLVGGLTALVRLSSTEPTPRAEDLPAPPIHNPTKLTAVILAGPTGAESIDLLAPYELLASSGAFNVYTLAPQRDVLPLFPGSPDRQGIHFVPHYSFSGYATAVGVRPDLVVVPWIPFDDTPATEALHHWLRDHTGPETMLLTICGGSWTAAQADLLDGYTVTSHQNILRIVGSSHPDTTWVSGQRWVHDRNIVSSAGISAAVDATLHIIREMVDRATADAVATHINYPHVDFLDDPRYRPLTNNPGLRNLNLAFRPDRTRVGLALYEGVGEIDVASIVDLHPRLHSNVVLPVSLDGHVVQTRHGLHLVAPEDAVGLDRLILPGSPDQHIRTSTSQFAARSGLQVETVHGHDFAFAAALRDIARHTSVVEAHVVAMGAEYPTHPPATTAESWPWELLVRPLLLGAVGLAAASAWPVVRRHRHTR